MYGAVLLSIRTGFAKGLLDVADNLTRAISAVPEQNKQVR
jgi:molecular chaperone GrpE (heat shock protein)